MYLDNIKCPGTLEDRPISDNFRETERIKEFEKYKRPCM
jgi:hypothetical protein